MPPALLAVGDSYLASSIMHSGLAQLQSRLQVRCIEVNPSVRGNHPTLSEHQGDVQQLQDELGEAEILMVHAAPVPAQLLDSRPTVRVVACARGNPLNVDLKAAAERGVTVLNTPGKNANSVADLTMMFIHMLQRGVRTSSGWLAKTADAGKTTLDSTFVGSTWMAREPQGATLGIIGFGAIGRLVAAQAEFYGMRVIAFDPYLTGDVALDPRLVSLEELLQRSDVITIHAKATQQNKHIINTHTLAQTKPGVAIINTARQALVDESALVQALDTDHVQGAALDVWEPDGYWPDLARHPRVLVTPHIGGATAQTQQRAMVMLSEDIRRYLNGQTMLRVIAGPDRPSDSTPHVSQHS